MKSSFKTKRDVEREDENGLWPVSTLVNFIEYCSMRMICYGCWAINRSFDDYPCNECWTQRPTMWSKTKPKSKRKVRQLAPKRVRKVAQ